MNPLQDALRAACAEVGIVYRDVPADGRFHSTDLEGDGHGRGDGRIKLFPDSEGGIVCNWKGERKVFFVGNGRALTETERRDRNRRQADMMRQTEDEEAWRRAKAQTKAAAIWKAAKPATADHPYLTRKRVSPVETLREINAEAAAAILGYAPKSGSPLAGRLLVVPVKVGRQISTVELIDEAGRKSAIAGGAKAGGYWAAQPIPEGNDDAELTLLIGEGVATVLSAKEASGHSSIAALSCFNLPLVATAIRDRYPSATLIILADLGNGQKHAEEAARSVGGLLATPDFGSNRPAGATDFNDMSAHCGVEAVKSAIANARTSAKAEQLRSIVPPWDAAQSAADFIGTDEDEIEFLHKPLLAPGSITEIFSPRGLGKTNVMLAIAKELSERGLRVLLLDRDNSRREVRRRLRAWGADSPNLKVMTRDDVPPLTDTAAWSTFPFSEYDVVVIDSLDSSTEGVGEQDSSKPAKAIAPLLDIAHKGAGPAILVLGNTIKSGAHSRGSGIVEDRADIVFEVRDATGLQPTGEKPWHEELPPCGAQDWASRATRRKQRVVYRLAFIPTKFRIGEEPAPFLYEIDLTAEPWQLRDVTAEVVAAGNVIQEDSRRAAEALTMRAIESLKLAIAVKEYTKTEAEEFLCDCEIKPRRAARDLIERHAGLHWNLIPHSDRKGKPFVLVSIAESKKESAAEIPPSRQQHSQGLPEVPICADSAGIGRRECPEMEPNTDATSGIVRIYAGDSALPMAEGKREEFEL